MYAFNFLHSRCVSRFCYSSSTHVKSRTTDQIEVIVEEARLTALTLARGSQGLHATSSLAITETDIYADICKSFLAVIPILTYLFRMSSLSHSRPIPVHVLLCFSLVLIPPGPIFPPVYWPAPHGCFYPYFVVLPRLRITIYLPYGSRRVMASCLLSGLSVLITLNTLFLHLHKSSTSE
ncbi:hypothetical protein V8E55_005816 [Tylopilus felleus]